MFLADTVTSPVDAVAFTRFASSAESPQPYGFHLPDSPVALQRQSIAMYGPSKAYYGT